ncbi:hypothetical protein Tco_0081694, partial [Tanacetum coccineum]
MGYYGIAKVDWQFMVWGLWDSDGVLFVGAGVEVRVI